MEEAKKGIIIIASSSCAVVGNDVHIVLLKVSIRTTIAMGSVNGHLQICCREPRPAL